MMIKLKIDLTPDENELLRHIIFKSTEFTAFNTKIFIIWLNAHKNLRLKELIKINPPKHKIFPEQRYPGLLKALVNLAHSFGTAFITNSLQPFLYQSNVIFHQNFKEFYNEKYQETRLELEKFKDFLNTAGLSFDKEDFLEFQFYLANNNYLSLDDYENLNDARFYIDITNLIKCIKENFKILNLEDKEQKLQYF